MFKPNVKHITFATYLYVKIKIDKIDIMQQK